MGTGWPVCLLLLGHSWFPRSLYLGTGWPACLVLLKHCLLVLSDASLSLSCADLDSPSPWPLSHCCEPMLQLLPLPGWKLSRLPLIQQGAV